MIEVTHKQGCITVSGHAGYAPRGYDIVCAAVSALVQTFIASVDKLTDDKINADMTAGNAVIQYGNLSAKSKTLMDSFFIGVGMIAEDYPDCVKIVQA